jgi:hypothetical protein
MTEDSAGEALKARLRADLPMWRERGIGVSTWGVDPETGTLQIGVRTPTSEAIEPLQQRYGPGTLVYYADVRPAGRGPGG